MKNPKTELIIVCIGVVFFFAFNVWNLYFDRKQALERLDFCYQQTKEVNLPMTVCSQINLQLNSVRGGAQVGNTALIMLVGASLIGTFIRIKRLESRIENLENEQNA